MSLGGARGGGDGAAGEGGGRRSGDALGVVGKGPAPWELLVAGAGAGQPPGGVPAGSGGRLLHGRVRASRRQTLSV